MKKDRKIKVKQEGWLVLDPTLRNRMTIREIIEEPDWWFATKKEAIASLDNWADPDGMTIIRLFSANK